MPIRSIALLLACAAIPLCLGDGPRSHAAVNGTIRGRVELRQPPPDLARRPNAADVAMPRPHDPTDRRRSVVYLESAPRAAFEHRDEARAKLDQRNETFVPHVLAIVAGTTVDFPNNDQTFHNVFSLSALKPFDLGRYAAGRSKSVRFDRPGVIRVFCDIHSHMSAFILVFAHRFFAVTDDDGRYRLDNVPPGTYTVIAWNESTPNDSRRVVVPESGGDVEANFVLGRR
ncbi:MAG TPA: carboxypeptidase regulatory-like domain-containing protein [Vicinamibacterales bacterium]|jgi:plastocyanin